LIVGNGAFKPNISTQVGNLYKQGDKRRDSAFGIFYMGINLGAFFSPLICGTLGEVYGWRYGFWTAGVGMLIGLVVYAFGQKYLSADNIMKMKEDLANGSNKAKIKEANKLTKEEKNSVAALMSLCFFNIVFWATYEQQGNTMALWADANTNRFVFGFEVPASWFQSLNPMMIFLVTPFLTKFWERQAARGTEPSSVTKMGIGCVLLASSYLIMIPASLSFAASGPVSAWWMIGCTFVLTLGELYLSPVGLSLVTKVAPVHMVSMLMGTWFLSSFAGNYLCGYIGSFWEKMDKHYFFLMLSMLSLFAGICILALQKPLKKAISSKHI
jgi:POT family proton-dependent oligopeptide transporter